MRPLIGLLLLLLPLPSAAETLVFDSAAAWQNWAIPHGLVRIDDAGALHLVKYRKEIDAVRDAHLFTHATQERGEVAGGIWAAGSGGATAHRAIDGDPADGSKSAASAPRCCRTKRRQYK